MTTERRIAPDGSAHHYVHITDEAAARDSISTHLITEIRAAESPEEAAEILERQAPWLAVLAMWLKDNSDYADWLNLVVAVIVYFAPSPADSDPPPPPPSPTQVEEAILEKLEELQAADTAVPPSAPPEPPGTAPSTSP